MNKDMHGLSTSPSRRHVLGTVNPEEILRRFPYCKRPLAVFDAYLSMKDGAAVDNRVFSARPIMEGGYSLWEDRPGKPGWISTVPGSTATFHLTFGDSPVFCINYLRSYEGMASASMFMNNCTIELDGLWPRSKDGGIKERVSLVDTMCVDAYAKKAFLPPTWKPTPSFNQPPNSLADLVITHRGHQNQKFKIVSVISC